MWLDPLIASSMTSVSITNAIRPSVVSRIADRFIQTFLSSVRRHTGHIEAGLPHRHLLRVRARSRVVVYISWGSPGHYSVWLGTDFFSIQYA